jgi:SNF2 family DNA or RNA helicase
MNYKRLVEIGDSLHTIQRLDPNSKDDSGFNSIDMANWPKARNNLYSVALMLKKYKRQIPEDDYKLVLEVLSVNPHVAIVDNKLRLNAKVAKSDFYKYLEVIKANGFGWNGSEMVLKNPSQFNRESLVEGLGYINLEVIGDIKIVEKSTKEKLASKELESKKVYVDVRDGYVHFTCSFNPTFNKIFKNQGGELSGLTEYIPEDHSRRTNNFDLALEAIGKIKELMPTYEIVDVGFSEALEAHNKAKNALSAPIPSVVKVLNPEYQLRPFQNEFVNKIVENDGKILCGDDMGLGKAQSIETPVLTPKGWKLIGELKIGDFVIGSNGLPTKVTGVFPQGKKDIYRCYFTDDSFTECCLEHLWAVNTPTRNHRNSPHIVRSLQEIIDIGFKDKNGNRKHFIPIVKPIEFSTQSHLITPYILGVLIGDGSLTHSLGFTKSLKDSEIINKVKSLLPNYMNINTTPNKNTYKHSIIIVDRKDNNTNPFYDELKKIGLNVKSNMKFIPKKYLFDSIENRLELLRGLMDTDGYVSEDGMHTSFDTSSKKLMKHVRFLIQSLGGVTYLNTKIVEGVKYYSLTVCLPEKFIPFSLSRKKDRFKPNLKYRPYRAFDRVKKIGKKEAVCISVEAKDRLYVTNDCILTHNTLETLAYIASQGKKAIIVAPKVVRRNWLNEAKKFFPAYFDGQCMEIKSTTKRGDITACRLYSINYDSFIKHSEMIETLDINTIVIDESHKIKNPKAKRTQAIIKMVDRFDHKILLSGTAVINKRKEIITQINFIDKNFGSVELPYGALWNKLTERYYIARTKREVAPELPPKVTTVIDVDIDLPNFPQDIGEMSTTRVAVALKMVPHTLDYINEILDSSASSVIVFSESREAVEALKKALGAKAILHHGQMSDDARENAKDNFTAKKARVFISTRQSLEVGANLQVADKVIFNDLPWTAADIVQAEDRAYRIGQKNQVDVTWMTASSGWYSNLIEMLERKYKLCMALNNGKTFSKEDMEWMSSPVSFADIKV